MMSYDVYAKNYIPTYVSCTQLIMLYYVYYYDTIWRKTSNLRVSNNEIIFIIIITLYLYVTFFFILSQTRVSQKWFKLDGDIFSFPERYFIRLQRYRMNNILLYIHLQHLSILHFHQCSIAESTQNSTILSIKVIIFYIIIIKWELFSYYLLLNSNNSNDCGEYILCKEYNFFFKLNNIFFFLIRIHNINNYSMSKFLWPTNVG